MNWSFNLTGTHPYNLLNLTSLTRIRPYCVDAYKRLKEIKQLREKVCEKIQKQNSKPKTQLDKHRRSHIFKKKWCVVRIHLWTKRLPNQTKSKLSPWVDGSFKIVQRINDNSHKVQLLREYGISVVFVVAGLSPWFNNEAELDLRMSLFQPRENGPGPTIVGSIYWHIAL